MQTLTTLKITNKRGENGGEWFAQPHETAKIEHAKKVTAEMAADEPELDWHLETRGTQSSWHRWGQT
jgi:hypothetical protein